MTVPSVTAVRRTAAADPRAERWTADHDSDHGHHGAVVESSAPGEHLSELTRPGEVELRVTHDGADDGPGDDGALPALVDAVVATATTRYASAVVVGAAGLADGTRRLLADRGFVPDPRGTAVHTLDLTTADDGTPTRMLDNPALASLNGAHARFAERRGEIVRYLPDVSVWTGVPVHPTEQDWADIAALLGPGAGFRVDPSAVLPRGWHDLVGAGGVQLTGEAVLGRPDPEAVLLTAEDVPAMLDLVARTKPGPFLPRTIELGTYLGIRREGRLVAMAGERLHPPGWTEISAVCTEPEYRGQGLGRRLVLAVAHGIRQRGETPMLHAAATNTGAIALYEHLGFRLRDRGAIRFAQVPQRLAV
ncbi:GNAT family N-acetyltransferase [Curtobacterium luteum]|nr:GNAT family N-acetyltransferase [Curtobacterium luteum]